MEMTTDDHSEPPAIPSTGEDHHENNMPSDTSTEGVMDCKQEIGEEEGRKILEIIASTGKFWKIRDNFYHGLVNFAGDLFRLQWEKLKSLLSTQLKQVLSEYPEVKMSTEEQKKSLLGETYEELVNRLDEALCSFIEGPPFTLQRLCEIILGARNIYPKLWKLALALEKNLLVTSTLTISTDPYPPPIIKESEEVEMIDEPQPQSDSVQNGVEQVTTGKDEVMVEVEAADDSGEGNDYMKVEASEEKSELTTPDATPTTDFEPVGSQSV